MKVYYMPLSKAQFLEESIGWLSNYTGPEENSVDQIGPSSKKEDKNVEYTDLLIELGNINKRRKEILNKFTDDEK